jgi:hypothetical protein
MTSIGQLYQQLQSAKPGSARVHHLRSYLSDNETADCLQLLGMATGVISLAKVISEDSLYLQLTRSNELPLWLIDAANNVTTERLETVALLNPAAAATEQSLIQLLTWRNELASITAAEQESLVSQIWQQLSAADRYFFAKLLTGKLRFKNYYHDLLQAAADRWQLDRLKLDKYLATDWTPTNSSLESLQMHCVASDYESVLDLKMQTANFYCIYAHADPIHSDRIYHEVTVAAELDDQIVPMGKVTTLGMPDSDYLQIVDYVRENLQTTYGNTKSITVGLVLEVAFSGVAMTRRRKSGLELLTPIITRIMPNTAKVISIHTLKLLAD